MTTTLPPAASNELAALAAAPAIGALQKNSAPSSWFQALADAWSQALDSEAGKIAQMSASISGGNDNPSQLTELTAETLRFGFLSQSENTSISSVGNALDTMARKG